MKKGQKYLYNVIKENLQKDEKIFITTKTKLNDLHDNKWYIMDEYSYDEIFNNISGYEVVIKYWHEDGLCIVLNK